MKALYAAPPNPDVEFHKYMKAKKTVDMMLTGLIIAVAALLLGYTLGLQRASFTGYLYLTGGWDWRWGLIGGCVPLAGSRALYNWLRTRRARRFYYG